MNNTPQEGMDKYNDAFKKIINYVNNNQKRTSTYVKEEVINFIQSKR